MMSYCERSDSEKEGTLDSSLARIGNYHLGLTILYAQDFVRFCSWERTDSE